MLPILAMEESKEEADINDLLKILSMEDPCNLFYEALPIVKKYNEEEIGDLPIRRKLKDYSLALKHEMNKKLFNSNGSVKKIKTLLDFGANVNAQNKNGNTLLSMASKLGAHEYVDSLLKRGANPNISVKGISPLMETALYLISKGKEPQLIKTAQLLIENNANVNAISKNNNSALSFATAALSDKMVQLLLGYRANPNIQGGINKSTPLMSAADEKTTNENRQRQINIIEMLISYGAKLFTRNNCGQTAYDLAVARENTEIAEILKEAMQKRGKEIYGLQKISKE